MTDKDAENADFCDERPSSGRNGLKLICGEIAFSHVATFSNRQFR